jgi:crossover junction endodeoxyribonuclease RuvC
LKERNLKSDTGHDPALKPEAPTSRIVLGIDPGSNIMGYGIIEISGKKQNLLAMDVHKSTKGLDSIEKLQMIFRKSAELIREYNVTEMAIEDPFYGKNVQSMLKLGRAQGMAIAAAVHYNISVHQYAARKIKQSITGNGNASKEQVAAMVQRLLSITEMPEHFDATDAVAVALCHLNQNTVVSGGSKFNSWKAFISNNPGRVK